MFHFGGTTSLPSTTVPNAAACKTKLGNLLKKINGEEDAAYEQWKGSAGIAAVRTTLADFCDFNRWVRKQGAEAVTTREAWLVGVQEAEATEDAAYEQWKGEGSGGLYHTTISHYRAFKAWKKNQEDGAEATRDEWLEQTGGLSTTTIRRNLCQESQRPSPRWVQARIEARAAFLAHRTEASNWTLPLIVSAMEGKAMSVLMGFGASTCTAPQFTELCHDFGELLRAVGTTDAPEEPNGWLHSLQTAGEMDDFEAPRGTAQGQLEAAVTIAGILRTTYPGGDDSIRGALSRIHGSLDSVEVTTPEPRSVR
jgi:hypothetical protein